MGSIRALVSSHAGGLDSTPLTSLEPWAFWSVNAPRKTPPRSLASGLTLTAVGAASTSKGKKPEVEGTAERPREALLAATRGPSGEPWAILYDAATKRLAAYRVGLQGIELEGVRSIGEIRRGIESVRRRDPVSAEALDRWLSDLVAESSERILAVDLRVAEEWGRLNVPDPLPVIDGLLAATARVHGLTLATRDIEDVGRTGISCVDPFALEA